MRDESEIVREIRDRARRIETRLTKFLEQSGFNAQTQRPFLNADDQLVIPSMYCSLKDILAAVPPSLAAAGTIITVVHAGEVVAGVAVPSLAKEA